MKSHVFDVLPAEYKPLRVDCDVNISGMPYKHIKKEIRWSWKTYLGGINKQEK